MIYAGVEELKRKHYAELAAARAKIRAEGRSTLICRLARLKFGGRAADRLAGLLDEVTEPDRVARIGDLIIECETEAELMERVRAS